MKVLLVEPNKSHTPPQYDNSLSEVGETDEDDGL